MTLGCSKILYAYVYIYIIHERCKLCYALTLKYRLGIAQNDTRQPGQRTLPAGLAPQVRALDILHTEMVQYTHTRHTKHTHTHLRRTNKTNPPRCHFPRALIRSVPYRTFAFKNIIKKRMKEKKRPNQGGGDICTRVLSLSFAYSRRIYLSRSRSLLYIHLSVCVCVCSDHCSLRISRIFSLHVQADDIMDSIRGSRSSSPLQTHTHTNTTHTTCQCQESDCRYTHTSNINVPQTHTTSTRHDSTLLYTII